MVNCNRRGAKTKSEKRARRRGVISGTGPKTRGDMWRGGPFCSRVHREDLRGKEPMGDGDVGYGGVGPARRREADTASCQQGGSHFS